MPNIPDHPSDLAEVAAVTRRLAEESRRQAVELREALERVEQQFAEATCVEPISDQDRERMREGVGEWSDAFLVEAFLTMHTLARRSAIGQTRSLLDRQAIVGTVLLQRFAPVAFADAMAVWSEHSQAEEDGNDTASARAGGDAPRNR